MRCLLPLQQYLLLSLLLAVLLLDNVALCNEEVSNHLEHTDPVPVAGEQVVDDIVNGDPVAPLVVVENVCPCSRFREIVMKDQVAMDVIRNAISAGNGVEDFPTPFTKSEDMSEYKCDEELKTVYSESRGELDNALQIVKESGVEFETQWGSMESEYRDQNSNAMESLNKLQMFYNTEEYCSLTETQLKGVVCVLSGNRSGCNVVKDMAAMVDRAKASEKKYKGKMDNMKNLCNFAKNMTKFLEVSFSKLPSVVLAKARINEYLQANNISVNAPLEANDNVSNAEIFQSNPLQNQTRKYEMEIEGYDSSVPKEIKNLYETKMALEKMLPHDEDSAPENDFTSVLEAANASVQKAIEEVDKKSNLIIDMINLYYSSTIKRRRDLTFNVRLQTACMRNGFWKIS